jgi:hypothetical protein
MYAHNINNSQFLLNKYEILTLTLNPKEQTKQQNYEMLQAQFY